MTEILPIARLLAALGLVVAFAAGGWLGWQAGSAQGRLDAAEARQTAVESLLDSERRVRSQETRAASAAAGVASASAARHARVEIRYQTLEKEVIRYVQTPVAAAECLDADGLRLWIAANRGELAPAESAGAGSAALP